MLETLSCDRRVIVPMKGQEPTPSIRAFFAAPKAASTHPSPLEVFAGASSTRSYKCLGQTDKPFLVRPKVGIYALYYILSKMGLISDSKSHFDTKTEVLINQTETEKTHKERLVELKKAIDDSKSTERWEATYQAMSWFMSFSGVVTGITLLMTGTAPIAGALLVCGGLISVTNQLLQVSDTWVHIAKKLPGTPEEKRMAIKWMQIGVTVLALVLTGSGIVFGGFTGVKHAFGAAQSMMGGASIMGMGALNFGTSVFRSRQARHEAEIRRHQNRIIQLRHRREDINQAVEASVLRLEKLFEGLAMLLEFDRELFRASEAINR